MRVVDAALDDGSCHEHIDLACREILHHDLELFFRHLAMRYPDARFTCRFTHALHRIIDRAHAIAHVVHLPLAIEFAGDGVGDHIRVPFTHVHFHGAAIIGRCHDQAHVAHARKTHLHRARNGCCRKCENIDRLTHVLQLLFVSHAEALFLVDDHKP